MRNGVDIIVNDFCPSRPIFVKFSVALCLKAYSASDFFLQFEWESKLGNFFCSALLNQSFIGDSAVLGGVYSYNLAREMISYVNDMK